MFLVTDVTQLKRNFFLSWWVMLMDVGRFTNMAAITLAIILNWRRQRRVSLAKQHGERFWDTSEMCRGGINTSID